MIVVERIEDVRKELAAVRVLGRTVGFVPTMGALHAGHLSLVRAARASHDIVVVSVFVNPAQFGPHEDLAAYPRTLESDLKLCEGAGVDFVFVPGADEMYPRPPGVRIVVAGLSEPMEGRARPGHFEGVALVVAKLFNIVGECSAYFGQKDAQQLRIVRRLAADLDLPVQVVGCPTVRDADGLALSSRNFYLSADERVRALALPRALFAIRDAAAAGERDARTLLARGRDELRDVEVDYLEMVDGEDLRPVDAPPALVCGAIRVGRTRLIDNVEVT
jgi:pantoate--beta-alanine ligase